MEVEEDLVGDGAEVPHNCGVELLLCFEEFEESCESFVLVLFEDFDEQPRVSSEHLLGHIGVPTILTQLQVVADVDFFGF